MTEGIFPLKKSGAIGFFPAHDTSVSEHNKNNAFYLLGLFSDAISSLQLNYSGMGLVSAKCVTGEVLIHR